MIDASRSPHPLLITTPLVSTMLIRLMVGLVFFSEGIQKWLYPETRGTGRFEAIGIPVPEFVAYMTGGFEVACGALLIVGLFARIAAFPLLGIMGVALLTTKLPILYQDGFWEMAHAARTDFCMTIGSIFILIRGAGYGSLDARIASGRDSE